MRSSVSKHWPQIRAFLARRIRYRITRGGVLFTFAMVVVGVGAIVSANNLLFLIVALIAGALGLSGVSFISGQIAWVLFVIFIILFLLSLVAGGFRRM